MSSYLERTYLPFCLVVSALLLNILGQQTDINPQSCTYSFTVPKTDISSTCSSYASQQVALLKQRIDMLQKQVAFLTQSGGSKGSYMAPKFQCNCDSNTTFAFTFRDCQDVKWLAAGPTGVYNIEPITSTSQLVQVVTTDAGAGVDDTRYWVARTSGSVKVQCDLASEVVGWTVLMRRSRFNVSFDRSYDEYKRGFGELSTGGDFWLGLDNMHHITSQIMGDYTLWIMLVDHMRVPHVLAYDKFSIQDETSDFALTLGNKLGPVQSILKTGLPFIAKNSPRRTGTSISTNSLACAARSSSDKVKGGGWWFTTSTYYYGNRCGTGNLNAPQPVWPGLTNFTSIEMKIRPNVGL